MALFTRLVAALQVLFAGRTGLRQLVRHLRRQWMKVLTFVVIVALAWHAWVGMRDIWMDYINRSACAWCCRCSPSSGWWAAPAGPFGRSLETL